MEPLYHQIWKFHPLNPIIELRTKSHLRWSHEGYGFLPRLPPIGPIQIGWHLEVPLTEPAVYNPLLSIKKSNLMRTKQRGLIYIFSAPSQDGGLIVKFHGRHPQSSYRATKVIGSLIMPPVQPIHIGWDLAVTTTNRATVVQSASHVKRRYLMRMRRRG